VSSACLSRVGLLWRENSQTKPNSWFLKPSLPVFSASSPLPPPSGGAFDSCRISTAGVMRLASNAVFSGAFPLPLSPN
jgi:hypothetical protein